MKIIVLAHFAGSPDHGMVYGHYFLARQWIKQGHEVTIIASGYVHTRYNNPIVGDGIYSEQNIDGIRYIWVKTPKYSPSNNIGRAINILCFSLISRYISLPLDKPDLVISSSHHTLSIFAARKIAKQFSAKLVYEVRDLWPLGLVEIGGISRKNPFIWLLQYAEDLSYKICDQIVSLMPYAKEYMVSRGMEESKFNYIPNGFDESIDSERLPESTGLHQDAIDRFREKESFIVAYVGNFGDANEIGTLISSLPLCKNKQVVLLLIGKGPHLASMERQVRESDLKDRVDILPPVSKLHIQALLRQVDLGFIGLKDRSMFRFGVSPTKVNDYFLAKIPVLYALNYKDQVIEDSGVVFQCAAGSATAIAKSIDNISSISEQERQLTGEKGYQWAKATRSYSDLAAKFIEAVSE